VVFQLLPHDVELFWQAYFRLAFWLFFVRGHLLLRLVIVVETLLFYGWVIGVGGWRRQAPGLWLLGLRGEHWAEVVDLGEVH
jgi:hypothetical protein